MAMDSIFEHYRDDRRGWGHATDGFGIIHGGMATLDGYPAAAYRSRMDARI